MDTPQHGGSGATVPRTRQHTTLARPHAAQPSAPAAVPQQQGPARIGPYEVFHLLGEGGMGRVYLARSPGSRLVALKVIRPEYAEAPNFRGRFRREADAARKVSGFFTPPVLDADADSPQPWLATAYIPAPSLHDVVRDFGVLPEPAVRALGTGLAEALVAIHAAGLVHRDLKPGNVLVAEDGPRVIDFGISRAVDATQVTRTGAVMGTPGFMAPEQIVSSREAGPAADVFSLGCVLVFAATGLGPFGAGNTAEILYRAVHAPPQLTDIPDALRSLLAACLDKDPAGRPSTAALLAALGSAEPSALLTPGLREDLARRQAHAAVLVTAPPIPVTPLVPGAPSGPSRRRFLWIAAAGGTAAAAAGAAALADWGSRPDRATGRGSGRGTAVRPGAKVPPGPKPQWSRPLRRLENGQLRLLGDTLVRWDERTAIGYDTATGQERWTAAPRQPSGATGKPTWLGVQGSMLYATAWGDRGYLLGLDGNGQLKFSHPVTEPTEGSSFPDTLHDVFCVAGSVALLGASGDQGYAVYALNLSTGKVLWSRKVTGSDFHASSDGHRCFLHDGSTVHGLDLRSGTVHWTVRDVVRPGDYPDLTTDGNALLVTSTKVQAFRATDGRRLWTAVDEPTVLNPATVLGNRAYVVDGQDTVFALGTGDGRQRWHTASPLSLDPRSASDPGPCVSSSLLAYPLFSGDTPGFIVLRTADGKVLWAHRGSGAETKNKSTAWRLQIAGTTLYAASDTTLYAFRSDPR
ncbi:protein kinase domain-containing protein [Streptomyces gilvosporeus]|uniref:Serine/threonine protein kinase n=1 Tax=Streptomyces gilvosporeus TaxID=553510 RepID=A0A1V0TKD3_9ACTN|nr:PQQ-binding-like beta-propeller repeat protein [Streptomyces gilvosporeus]ARF53112.1 serine/threonine protein kinase [Streptomyces gilvosporeus]